MAENKCTDWDDFIDKIADDVTHKNLARDYLLKLGKNCMDWSELFALLPSDIDYKTLLKQCVASLESGEPSRLLPDEEMNRMAMEVVRESMELEKFHKDIVAKGVEEQVMTKIYRQYMKELHNEAERIKGE